MRMLQNASIEDSLNQVREYGGFWALLSNMTRSRPHISYRITLLLDSGLLRPVPDLPGAAKEDDKGDVSKAR